VRECQLSPGPAGQGREAGADTPASALRSPSSIWSKLGPKSWGTQLSHGEETRERELWQLRPRALGDAPRLGTAGRGPACAGLPEALGAPRTAAPARDATGRRTPGQPASAQTRRHVRACGGRGDGGGAFRALGPRPEGGCPPPTPAWASRAAPALWGSEGRSRGAEGDAARCVEPLR
jgi:hypothetical protein